tara:strand:- start:301 stop:423 length:123 start_codon:yes stop_codon:yes gene_type:complete
VVEVVEQPLLEHKEQELRVQDLNVVEMVVQEHQTQLQEQL